MIEYRLFIQRVGLIGLVSLFSSLSNMVLLPVLTKNMPLADFGIWSQVNVTMGLVSTFMLLGLPDAFTRFAAAAKSRDELQERFYTIFAMILVWGTIIALVVLYCSGIIATTLFHDNIFVARIVPLLILIHSQNILFTYFFRTTQQMKKYSVFSFLTIILDIVLISYFVLTGHGIYGAVIALLISRMVLFFTMLPLITMRIGIKIPQFKDARAYLMFGLPLVPSILSGWVVNSSDRFIINLLLGTAAVALYSPGYILGNIVGMFVGPLGFVLPIDLSKYHDGNRRDAVELMLNRSLKYYLAVAIPAVFGVSLLSKPILTILSTQEIASQGYMITPFIAVSMILYGVTVILSNILALMKKTVHISLIWMGAAVLNLVMTLVLVRYMGIIGGAMATLTAFTFVFLLTAYCSFRYIKPSIDYIFLLKSVLASMIMSTVILVWIPSSLWGIFIEIGICAAIYFVTLFLLGGIERKEIAFFKEALSH